MTRHATRTALILALAAGAGSPPATPAGATPGKPKEATVTRRATGTFEVKITPIEPHHKAEGGATAPPVGRMAFDKTFQGPLDARSRGEMLTAMTAVKGSAGYVAVESVEGTLDGRRGAFALQHSGVMNRGVPSLSVAVVPDSGTGGLAGITGTMTIRIEGGKHFYDFDYALPDAP